MVLLTDVRLVVLLSIGMTVAVTQGKAADTQALPDLTTLAPHSHTIHSAEKSISRLGCTTQACIAVVRLRHIFNIIDDGEVTTMGDARYYNPNEPEVEEKYLHRVLLDHPNRYPPMCMLLTGLASRYGRPGAKQEVDEELYVGVEVVSIASRMDGNAPPSCLPAVLAAMPHTPEADTAIGNARDLCEGSQVVHDPCSRITR